MNLFDFTRVEEKKPFTPINKAQKVYLASENGFATFCEGCARLVAVQEINWTMFQLRIFCSLEKCEKPCPSNSI